MTSDYAALPDEQAAALISAEVADWDRQEPLRYAALGLMALAVEKRMLWRYVPGCTSFATWVRCCAPKGYSTVYSALRDCEALADVPAADLAQIPHESFPAMKHLSTGVRKLPEVLNAAKAGRDALVQHIQKHHTDQHIEATEDLRLHPTEGQKAEILAAIAEAIQCGDAGTKEEAVFMWAINYRQDRLGANALHGEASRVIQ